jgi:hypothetical protein
MAEVTSLAIPAAETPRYADDRLTPVLWSQALTSGMAASADTVTVATLPANARVVFATLRVDGSLGTGATIQLRQNASALTGATTAGGADQEILASVVGPATSATKIDLLVGTSAVTASANVQVTLGYVI